jgi:hypothetical protein
MSVHTQIVEKIIKAQELIIGPVAVEQAQQISGLQLDWVQHKVVIQGDESKVVDSLIESYKQLFGQISVEVSKEAASSLINQLPAGELPKALK